MILEKFYTNKYDNDIVIERGHNQVSMKELKEYICAVKKTYLESNIQNVVICCDDGFDFIVNFFASVFAHKTIYLITDKNRLKMLNFNYILAKENIASEYEKLNSINDVFGEINPQEVNINFFTSGSSGKPKNVTKNLTNMDEETHIILNLFKFINNLVFYSTTTMAHMFGIVFQFIIPFSAGYVINTDRIEYPEQITTSKPYVLISTPSFLEKMAKYNINFSSPPYIIFSAGDKLNSKIKNFFNKNSLVVDIYGSTESGTIAYRTNTEYFNILENVSVSQNNNSCLIVNSNFFNGKNLQMEDKVRLLSDEKFILLGRNDRIVKIREKRISLPEIENILNKHKDVCDAYCFKYENDLVCAIVTDNKELNSKELKTYLSDYSEITPKRWRFLDEIPKTSNGKINREKLEHIFGLNLSYPFILHRKKTEESVELKLLFKGNSNFFRGHFDVMPVLPGVVQLFYANWFANDVFNIKLPNKEAKRIKYSNIIKPDEELILKLTNKDNSVEFTYSGDDKVYSSGIFVK